MRLEFVRWNETDPVASDRAFETTTVDVSARGLGLSRVPTLTSDLKQKLISGHLKVRLTLTVDRARQLHLFGRLVWAGLELSRAVDDDRAGLSFIDIPDAAFWFLKEYVEKRLPIDS